MAFEFIFHNFKNDVENYINQESKYSSYDTLKEIIDNLMFLTDDEGVTPGIIDSMKEVADWISGHQAEYKDLVDKVVGADKDTNDKLGDIDKKIKDLEGLAEELRKLIDGLQGESNSSGDRLKDLEDKIKELDDLKKELEGLLKKLEGLGEDSGDIASIVADLQSKVNSLEDTVGKIKSCECETTIKPRVETVEQRVNELQDSIDDFSRELGEIKNRLMTLEGKPDCNCSSELIEIKNRLTTLEENQGDGSGDCNCSSELTEIKNRLDVLEGLSLNSGNQSITDIINGTQGIQNTIIGIQGSITGIQSDILKIESNLYVPEITDVDGGHQTIFKKYKKE